MARPERCPWFASIIRERLLGLETTTAKLNTIFLHNYTQKKMKIYFKKDVMSLLSGKI